MNYLGHISLTFPATSITLGNLTADLLSLKQIDALDQDIKAGVVFHRKLDAFCDAHESYKTMLPIFKPAVGRYAPVALDIILDYFLAKNWSHFYTIPFEIFSDQVYKMLKQNASKLPDSIQLFILKIVEDRWLRRYSSLDEMKFVLDRMNRKAKFDVDFTKTIPKIVLHSKFLNEEFLKLFEAIVKEKENWLNPQNGN
ncbi:MAG TPA: ACP phosphodiesterase [Saprospiraceae bacterium]|mgnify:CR=1 FL=1|nr:ACP phosphodiesterase [Saprospiraceae bacterium]